MNRYRVTTAVLICTSLLTLTACAGEDSTTTAGSAPAASTAPSAPATTTSAAAPAAAGGTSDKELCTTAKKAGDDMKKELIDALKAGQEPSPTLFKTILTNMHEQMTTLSAASDSKVAAAMQEFGTLAAESAKAADPAEATDNPAFEKAGAAVTAACKPTGINVNF